jgi:hypothetical protein
MHLRKELVKAFSGVLKQPLLPLRFPTTFPHSDILRFVVVTKRRVNSIIASLLSPVQPAWKISRL